MICCLTCVVCYVLLQRVRPHPAATAAAAFPRIDSIMATNVTLPCNGHGLEIKAGSCWCDPPWTELDCSLTWSESSEYDFYNTYRITLITLGVIWTLIYTWRFLVVIPAKWRRARSHASSMLATPRRIAWTIFDDQFRCLIFGIITSVMSAINGSDPFAAETSPALHFNRYSVSIATDCARYAAVFLTVLLCTRFFIKLQAVFHPPSRVMLKGITIYTLSATHVC